MELLAQFRRALFKLTECCFGPLDGRLNPLAGGPAVVLLSASTPAHWDAARATLDEPPLPAENLRKALDVLAPTPTDEQRALTAQSAAADSRRCATRERVAAHRRSHSTEQPSEIK
ncbi:hypothetical protein [Streptomyces mirabilis]|uniref:hypothetical protein n=1 Tax=Streptomyces mirabilis TaxID=68239 RepID=UPI00367E66A3